MSNNYKLIIDGIELKNFGDLKWSDNIDGLSTKIEFSTTTKLNVGNHFTLSNGSKTILVGIIINESYDKNKFYQYTGFDYGFYLNKNEIVIQFNGCSAKDAITQLLNKVEVPIGNIANIPITVKKIYKKIVVSDILREILDDAFKKTGKKYSIKQNVEKVNIVQSKEILVNAFYDLSGQSINITDTVSDFQASNSIENLKNKILVVDSGDKDIKILASATDENSRAKYGLLQQIETPSDDDKSSKSIIAANLLKELNQITETRSVEMLGSDDVVSGVILVFDYPDLDFTGKYFVRQVNHSFDGTLRKMECDLVAYVG